MPLNIEKNIKNLKWDYIITMSLLFLFIGVVIAVHIRAQAENDVTKGAPSRQLKDIVVLLKEAEEKKKELEKQIADLQKQIKDQQLNKNHTVSKDQLEKVYQIAGLTEVSGKGILIILDDRKTAKTTTPDNDGLIHADDILKLANELKSAGTSAIAVNNQRLVTTSEIIEAGNSIMINQTRLSSPYEVKALGNPEILKGALLFRGSIIQYLKYYGIDVQIKTDNKTLKLPAYSGKLE